MPHTMTRTPMTVKRLISALHALPPTSPIYLASDPEGNGFAPVDHIGLSPTRVILLFPADVLLDDDEWEDVLGTEYDLVA